VAKKKKKGGAKSMSFEQLSRGRALVVLLVEDDVFLRMMTASNLRWAGFDVIEAAHAAEAVRILEWLPVDALFTDINMPGEMDGLALARWVHHRRLDTRIILTSGVQLTLGESEKYASFLAKPYDNVEVERHLRSVLSSHESLSREER
jgi:two-component system, response regulator PdtaR